MWIENLGAQDARFGRASSRRFGTSCSWCLPFGGDFKECRRLCLRGTAEIMLPENFDTSHMAEFKEKGFERNARSDGVGGMRVAQCILRPTPRVGSGGVLSKGAETSHPARRLTAQSTCFQFEQDANGYSVSQIFKVWFGTMCRRRPFLVTSAGGSMPSVVMRSHSRRVCPPFRIPESQSTSRGRDVRLSENERILQQQSPRIWNRVRSFSIGHRMGTGLKLC